jgi:hypothetical protein
MQSMHVARYIEQLTRARSAPTAKQRLSAIGGIVSAGLVPTGRIASVCAISCIGNGMPRSIPNARSPAAAADAMQKRPL